MKITRKLSEIIETEAMQLSYAVTIDNAISADMNAREFVENSKEGIALREKLVDMLNSYLLILKR